MDMDIQPNPPFKPPHRFVLHWIVASIAIIVVIAYFVTFYYSSQPLPIPPPPESAVKDLTANWKTYTNTEYGFEVKYPGDWEVWGEFVNTTQSGDFVVGIRPKNWLETRMYDNISPMYIAIYKNQYQAKNTESIMSTLGFKSLSDGSYGIQDLNTKTIRPATEIEINGWKGLKGVSSIALSSIENKLDISAVENLRAFLARDGHYFVEFTMYPIISNQIFDQILSTFKFIK